MTKRASVIAIDGPAASGKSTVAFIVAKALGGAYINTGNMYRALALAAIKRGSNLDSANRKDIGELLRHTTLEYAADGAEEKIFLDGENVTSMIRSSQIAAQASKIAAIPKAREWLVKKQRQIAKNKPLSVMEGRDIGTVVFPNAKWKFFLTASPEVRAKRRLEQSAETTEGATVASVAREIAERDRMDMSRKVAPLTKADDAILIDSNNLSVNEVANQIIKTVSRAP